MEEINKAIDLWRAGKIEEAKELLKDVFDKSIISLPDSDYFKPYAAECNEFRNFISKLYVWYADDQDSDSIDLLLDLEKSCGGGLISKVSARLVGSAWEELREEFYNKCPECMFLGEADHPYSLKLRGEGCIECIPEDIVAIREITAMDGYNFLEGYALVKDDPNAAIDYPPEILKILEKLEEQEMEYFPNVIFPLTNEVNILEACRRMKELLQLLDYGYRFESITTYITEHPELFPDLTKRRLTMLQACEDDEEEEEDNDDDFDLDFLFEDDENEEDEDK